MKFENVFVTKLEFIIYEWFLYRACFVFMNVLIKLNNDFVS